MSLPQRKFREIVFQLLYSIDVGGGSDEELTKLMMKELSVTKKAVSAALARVHEIRHRLELIDDWIKKVAVSYPFERIQKLDLNILRLGVYELVFDDVVPPKVAIAEAVRLTRKFGSPESGRFVNALLDNIRNVSEG